MIVYDHVEDGGDDDDGDGGDDTVADNDVEDDDVEDDVEEDHVGDDEVEDDDEENENAAENAEEEVEDDKVAKSLLEVFWQDLFMRSLRRPTPRLHSNCAARQIHKPATVEPAVGVSWINAAGQEKGLHIWRSVPLWKKNAEISAATGSKGAVSRLSRRDAMAPKRGGLSLARKKELQNLFHSADTDASGLLSFTEMSMVLREGNPSLTDKELALLFREIDTNGDLTVDFKEFARYLNSMSATKLKKSKSREQMAADRCKEEFWRVDENSDGTLSRGEMTLLLRKGNPEITEEELELLFDTMDQDGNGSLDFSEFVDYITGAKAPGPEPEPEKEVKFSDTIFWVDTVPLPEVYQQRSSHIAMAHERAIYRSQLDELMKLIKEVLEAVSISEGTKRLSWGSLNMYQASEHFLKPLTLRFDPCSFVELVAAEPQVPEWFVSHWWGTPLVQTFAMLKYHQEQREGKTAAWWIDSFARCLHCVTPSRFPAPKDLEDAPFCKVLISTSCVGSVVLLDSTGIAFSRSWCLLEFALSLDMPKLDLDRYEILGELGSGGFGVVREAWDKKSQMAVAVKHGINAPELIVLEKMSGTFGFLDFYNGGPGYAIMELAGPALQMMPNKKQVLQMRAAIRQLHLKNIAHLDVKPANFVFGRGGKAEVLHLIDFGTATPLGMQIVGFVGSRLFASPSVLDCLRGSGL
eukprot:s593_g20.t1